MSELEACFFMVLMWISGIATGWLWGYTRGHQQCIDAWRKSNREIFGK
jgi:hypothetical protein